MKKLILNHTWTGFLVHTAVMVLAGFYGGKLLTTALNETIAPTETPTEIQKEARLVLSPNSALIKKDSRIAVQILVYPGTVTINAVGVTLHYPANLKVVDLSRKDSFCTLYPEEIVRPNDGTVRIACGTPSPGLTASAGVVGTVIFEAVENGIAPVNIDAESSSVHANDGKGTDVLAKVSNTILRVATPKASAQQKEPTLPQMVMLSSPTHPNQNTWYSSKNPALHWLQEEGITGYATLLDQNPQGIPNATFVEKTGIKIFEGLTDGIWYAHVRGKNSTGLGPISHFKIQIDTTPPDLNLLIEKDRLAKGEAVQLTFSGEGSQEFRIKIGNESFATATSPVSISNLSGGNHRIYVRAVDRAGNITERSVTVYVQIGFFEDLWEQIRQLLFREN